MKNTIKIAILLMITGFFTACQQPQRTEQLLANETQRKEVMQTIVNNQEMMQGMMGMMHQKGMMNDESYKNGMNVMEKGMMKGKGMQ